MATFRIPISSGSIRDAFSDIPSQGRLYFRGGFSILSKVAKERWDSLLLAAVESFNEGYGPDTTKLSSLVGLSEEDTRTALGTLGMVSAVMSSRKEAATEFVDVAISTGILDEGLRVQILDLVNAVSTKRDELRKVLERSSLAKEVLPSINEFDVAVDVRLSFSQNGPIEFGVPVAVVHLDTDAYKHEIWFQMTKRQVQRMVDDLQEALRRMDETQKWLDRSK